MKDKLYISVVNFKSSTLSEAGQVLQRYLDLGIDPILTDTDILVSVFDCARLLSEHTDEYTEYIDVYNIYDEDGNEVHGWYVDVGRQSDNTIQGRLTCRGVGCLKFTWSKIYFKFLSGGIISSSEREREMISRISARLGITS